MDISTAALRLIFFANIVVAGSAGAVCLVAPLRAAASVFENAFENSGAIRVVGALWLGIAIVSAAGVFRPLAFAPILLLQFVYKTSWVLIVAAPALLAGEADSMPRSMSLFFLAWTVVLPFVIPWQALAPST